jgi:uncharacterized membrane protein YGL010W
MKTLDQWFEEYAVSHQNPTNIAVHFICVPAIFFSIIGFFMSIPNLFLVDLLGVDLPVLVNWASVVILLLLLFYVRLSVSMAFKILIFSAICLGVNYFISQYVTLWIFSLVLFVLAWIGQFYGHKVEGVKPSFLKDIQFLLIGPAWVIKKIMK